MYDPSTRAWTAIAPMRYARERASAAWINGRIYLVGGWDDTGATVPQLEIYNPASNNWSHGSNAPDPLAASGVAVADARLYLVGGCDRLNCGHDDVQVYDPAADSWRSVATYPEPTSWAGCGTLYGQLDCAGGETSTGETADAFAYDPQLNRWAPIASLPIDLSAMGYAVADHRLLLTGGITQHDSELTNQGFSYDPDNNEWTALPNANSSLYRAASACGLYTVGGSLGDATGVAQAEQLPGYSDCDGNFDVGWLSESTSTVTLAPGKSATITFTVDAGDASVAQPGDYSAELAFAADTPYAAPPVHVTLTATPPKTWGKLAGTVLGAELRRHHNPARRRARPGQHLGRQLFPAHRRQRSLRDVARPAQQPADAARGGQRMATAVGDQGADHRPAGHYPELRAPAATELPMTARRPVAALALAAVAATVLSAVLAIGAPVAMAAPQRSTAPAGHAYNRCVPAPLTPGRPPARRSYAPT